jgi:hypothetical protein
VRGGRKEVEAMEVVLDRGKIAPHDSKQYVALEFLNFANPVQRKDAVHRKKVRKHAMKQSWQARKDHPVRLFSQVIAKPASWRDPLVLDALAKYLDTSRMEVQESGVHTTEVASLVSLH